MVSEKQIVALVERFEHKLVSLTGLYTEAKKQIEQLERENDALQESLKEEQKLVIELRKKTTIPEKNTPNSKDSGIIVKDNPSDKDTNAELKQQLDEYIRELERCIAHLSSLS
ncbi:hypothetical protein EXU85_06165 [Spirosoma sp. KCTC 42546]|uniref:hypothetical protein n=1 Tax=Spirosoma sp. KCTC 42546 TaxID=2520506 RepID=UPI001158E2D0|nr:hypothetical protein [Spirosoma sp. KCTC 42546]QDK78202.1 hypothetical protein EXU85_06165 [Spirosoma sp. KCTC 42546]